MEEDNKKSREELLDELSKLRRRVLKLDKSEALHKKAEEKARENEQRFRSLVEATSDWVWEVDHNGFYTYASPKVRDLLGYEPEEVIGLTPFDLMSESEAERMRALFLRVRDLRRPFSSLENVNIHKDGHQVVLDTSGVPILDSNKKLLGYRGIDRDITERKRADAILRESESRFRELADSLPQIVTEMDGKGNITFVNKNAFLVSGYTTEDLDKGMTVLQMVAPEEHVRLMENIERVICGESFNSHEYTVVRKDGSRFPAAVYSNPISSCGKVVGCRAILMDITHLKRQEQALRRSETQYRTLLENISDGVFMVDREGRFTFVNDVIVERSRHPREWFIGRRFTDIVRHDYRDLSERHFRSDMDGGESPPFEVVLSYSVMPGQETWVEVNRKPLFDSGRVVAVFGTSRDISARKRMEEEIRESEGKFRSLVERSDAGVYLIQDDVFRYANARFAEMLGYTVEEVVDRMAPGDVVFPEDYRRFSAENIRKRLAGEVESMRYGIRMVTKTGQIRYMEAYGSRTVYRSRPAVIGTILDVTDRKATETALKESEERYRGIFENSPVGIFQSTFEGRFIKVNPALAVMLGYESPQDLIDSVSDMATQVYVEPSRREEILREMRDGYGRIAYEAEFLRRDGRRWTGRVTMSTINDADGIPHHLDGIVEDVTEKKAMEERLRSTMERLRYLSHRLLEIQEKERRYLAVELHDEMGQVLTALRISLKRAERSKGREPAAADINESVRMVDGLIERVRNLSIELRPSILDDFGLTAALDWYVNWLSVRTGLRIVFSTDIPEMRFPPVLELTSFRITQEALTNAVRHADARFVVVLLEARDGELHLTVEDDGKGFNTEEVRRKELKGRNFGLLGMQERVSLAEGHLDIRSQPGKGTTIHACFPLPAIRGD